MKRLQFRRLPIFTQLVLFIVAALVIPLGLITYASNERLLAYSEEEIVRSAQSSLQAKARLVANVCDNILYRTINFSREPLLNDISTYLRYDEMQSGAERFQAVRKLANRLKDNAFSASMIHSIYFWLQGSDYLITTRNATVRLDDFYDLEWMEQQGIREAPATFRNRWIGRKLPYDTNGEPVGSRGHMDAITYLYRMTNYTTDARGILAVNLFEKDFSDLLNESTAGPDSTVFLMDRSGMAVSHPDKTVVLTDLAAQPDIRRLLETGTDTGWFIGDVSGERTLYCWTKASFADWYFVGRHSLDTLLDRASTIRNQTILLTLMVALACVLLVLLFSRHMTNPITRLMKKVMSQEGYHPEARTNEIEFLSQAFDQITQQEAELNQLLQKKETGLVQRRLLDALHGNTPQEDARAVLSEVFPDKCFQVALIGVDRQQLFNNRYTPDQRQVMRGLACQCVEAGCAEGMRVRAVPFDEDKIAILINFDEEGLEDRSYHSSDAEEEPSGSGAVADVQRHAAWLARLQLEMNEVFGCSVSIGVSEVHREITLLHRAVAEAAEALRGKLLAGHGVILFHETASLERNRYYYPFEREKHILNQLRAGDPDRIRMEIRQLADELRQARGVTHENILQVFNGLIGTSIRYFVENNINLAKAFPNLHAVYLEVAWQETLDDLAEYLVGFYERILPLTKPEQRSDASYPERIMALLAERSKTEIDFERLADEIGISYSYLRKIVKDETGKSPLDYINTLRIAEAKRLLRQTTLSVNEIAMNLGYANAQSLTRFFKKFEGITPGEFRNHRS